VRIKFSLIVFLSAATAYADVPLTGRIYSNIYAPTRNFDEAELQQSAVGMWLETSPRFSAESSAHLSISGDARSYSKARRESVLTTGEAADTSFVMDLREGYGTYATNSFVLRIGKQIIPWGKSDFVNPTDYLGAEDLTYLSPDREMRRIGALSTQFSFTPGGGSSPFSLDLVWTPVFPQSKMMIPTASLPSGVTVATSENPRIGLRDTEIAGKASYVGQGWDVSVSGFKGWSHKAEFFEKSRSLSATGYAVSVASGFYKQGAIGADFSFTAGGFVFRGEGAYKRTANYNAVDPTRMPTYSEGVFGIEKKFWDDFRLQVQGLWRGLKQEVPKSTDSITAAIASANQLIHGYQTKNRAGASTRLAYDNADTAWKAEIFYLYYDTKDYLWRPLFGYQWSDAFVVNIGGEQYGGPKDKPLGSLHGYNSVFLETKYVF